MKNMRKLIKMFGFLAIVILTLNIGPIQRAHAAGADNDNIVYEDGKRVYDYADLLTSTEEEKLNKRAIAVEDNIKTELYILTTNDTGGKSSMEYADDFGDNGAFGYECEYGSYIIMLINMQEREVWISTSGVAEDYFSEYRIERLLDDIFEYMPDRDYYNACMTFLKSAEKFMLAGAPGKNDEYKFPDYTGNEQFTDNGRSKFVTLFLPCFLISAVIGAVVVCVMVSGNKSKMTVGSRTYMSGNGVNVIAREDIFTHTTTVKHRINTDNGGSHSSGGSHSGGGGHHVSSGGHSHGGGGRHF